ncbi:hypothetical protein LT493_39665 [Streptomyces tricolor]|nr:hypothetical protein [Streptomyces tricolor]
MAGTSTHTVTNQPPPLVGYDVFTADRALAEGRRPLAPARTSWTRCAPSCRRSAGPPARPSCREWAVQANEHPPRLRSHDRYGHRIDEVEFHPAWHRLLGRSVSGGLTGAWTRPSGHVRRAAGFLVWTQVEAGTCCPLSMTHAAVPRCAPIGTGRRVGAPADVHGLRPAAAARGAEARRAVRDGHDREAGRQRRPREHHGGTALRRPARTC